MPKSQQLRFKRWVTGAIVFPWWLVGCASSSIPAASPVAASPIPSPSLVAASLPVASQLTPAQQTQLLDLGIKIILPSYLPTGFQLANVDSYKKRTNQVGDYSAYSLLYKGPKNQCFRLYSGNQGFRYQPAQRTLAQTKLGPVTVDYGEVGHDRRFMLIQAGFQDGYVLMSGGRIPNTGAANQPDEYCDAVSLREYLKVLQGLEELDSSTQPQSSTQTTQTAQTLARGLAPVPTDVCSRTSFYRIKTPDGTPLLLDGRFESRKVPAGTIVLLDGGDPRKDPEVWVRLDEQFEAPVAASNLAQMPFGSSFKGKMKVKTLEGGSVNVRSQPLSFGPDAKYILGTFSQGTEVTVLGAKGEWYYVVGPKNLQGFVAASFLVCS